MDSIPTDPKPAGSMKKTAGRLRKPAKVMRRMRTAPKQNKTEVTNKEKAVPKPSGDVDKRMASLLAHKQKLEAKSEKLDNVLHGLRVEHNYTSQERDRLQQLWQLSRNELGEEKETTLGLEKKMQQMRTQQAEHVTRLHQKMRSLVLNAKTHRFASTQTEPIVSGTGQETVICQTEEEMNKEKAAMVLRQSDALLTAFIAEMEKEKQNAQSDLKYAVVQLEQRMKEETDAKIRRLNEDYRRQLEEMSTNHTVESRATESGYAIEKEQLLGKVDYLQKELLTVREMNDVLSRDLEAVREQVRDQARSLGRAETQTEDMRKELTKLVEYKKTFQRDVGNVAKMKSELAKYKDINEIIMGEFAKMEKERDELLRELEKGVTRMGQVNGQKYHSLRRKTDAIQNKLTE